MEFVDIFQNSTAPIAPPRNTKLRHRPWSTRPFGSDEYQKEMFASLGKRFQMASGGLFLKRKFQNSRPRNVSGTTILLFDQFPVNSSLDSKPLFSTFEFEKIIDFEEAKKWNHLWDQKRGKKRTDIAWRQEVWGIGGYWAVWGKFLPKAIQIRL